MGPTKRKKLKSSLQNFSYFTITDGLLLVTVTCWGTAYLFTKIGLGDFHPLVFASFRSLITAPAFLLILVGMEKRISISTKSIPLFVLMGIFGNFLNRLCWTYGISLTTISNASILWSVSPIFVAIYSLL